MKLTQKTPIQEYQSQLTHDLQGPLVALQSIISLLETQMPRTADENHPLLQAQSLAQDCITHLENIPEKLDVIFLKGKKKSEKKETAPQKTNETQILIHADCNAHLYAKKLALKRNLSVHCLFEIEFLDLCAHQFNKKTVLIIDDALNTPKNREIINAHGFEILILWSEWKNYE